MIPTTSTSRLQKGHCILFLVLPFLTMAQGDTFQDDTNDLAAVPIDNYILLALLLGIFFAYRFFKTQYAIKTKN
jgi:amino acid permease